VRVPGEGFEEEEGGAEGQWRDVDSSAGAGRPAERDGGQRGWGDGERGDAGATARVDGAAAAGMGERWAAAAGNGNGNGGSAGWYGRSSKWYGRPAERHGRAARYGVPGWTSEWYGATKWHGRAA
jgi:hypothetical protein